MTMPRNKKEYERDILLAYQAGMTDGYGLEHTDIYNEERTASEEFMKNRNFKYSYDELIKGECII